MKQKFVIGKTDKNELEIIEYSELEKDQFFIIHKNVYDNTEIEAAIESGNNTIIYKLRNKNFFPSKGYMDQIVEAVKEIYSLNNSNSVEIDFNDQDFNIQEIKEVEEVEEDKENKTLDNNNKTTKIDEIDTLLETVNSTTSVPKIDNKKDA